MTRGRPKKPKPPEPEPDEEIEVIELVSLDNWKIIRNIPDGKYIGFKTWLGKIIPKYPIKKLDEAYKKYLNEPAFKEE